MLPVIGYFGKLLEVILNDAHIHQKINKAYSMLGIIKRNFIHMDPRTLKHLSVRM